MRTKEQIRQYNQNYYEKNKEKVKDKARQYYHENKEKVLKNVHEYREENREKIQEKGREYYRRKPENRMLNRARARAKKQGLEFDLTEQDIKIPTHCPLLGIKLFTASGRKSVKDNSASLDRIDSSKGYLKENVWVISHKANTIKNNATLEDIQKLAQNWEKLSTGRMVEIDEEDL